MAGSVADPDGDLTVDATNPDESSVGLPENSNDRFESEAADEPPASKFVSATLASLVILLLAALVTGSVFFVQSRAVAADRERDDTVLATARAAAVNLVTLRYDSAREDLDQILASTTGDFRNQFSDVSGSFERVLGDGQVDSTGRVDEAGLVGADDTTATVIAAVTSTVKNTQAPEGEERKYRMKITLDNVDDAWLVSNVEFVA